MKKKIVAIYIRVSTNYQIDKDSLPVQKKALISYCKTVLGIKEYEVFEDGGYSGKNTKRPGYQRMLAKIKAGEVSHVMVYKIDRISRNLIDFSMMYKEFKECNVTFISLNEQFDTSSAMGEAMLKIILVFAELERQITSERVYSVMKERAREGKWNGANVPLGYKWNEEAQFPTPDENEKIIVQKIFELYLQWKSSVKIRSYLNENNIKTKRGGTWRPRTVSNIIRNPFYKGTLRYNYRQGARGKIKNEEEWIIVKNNHEAIIDEVTWEKCNKIMDENAAAKNKTGQERVKKYTHVFSGLLRCNNCGSSLLSQRDKARENGFTPSLYRCADYYHKRVCNNGSSISDVVLGPFIFNYIRNLINLHNSNEQYSHAMIEKCLLHGPEFDKISGLTKQSLTDTFNLLYSCETSYYKPEISIPEKNTVSEEKNSLVAKLSKLERAQERLKKLYLYDDDTMNEKEYLESKIEIETQIVDVNNALAELKKETTDSFDIPFINTAATFLLAHKLSTEEHIEYSDFAPVVGVDALKEFANSIIDNIVIRDRRVEKITFKNGLVHTFIWR